VGTGVEMEVALRRTERRSWPGFLESRRGWPPRRRAGCRTGVGARLGRRFAASLCRLVTHPGGGRRRGKARELDPRQAELGQAVLEGRLGLAQPATESLDERRHGVDRQPGGLEAGRIGAQVERRQLEEPIAVIGHDDLDRRGSEALGRRGQFGFGRLRDIVAPCGPGLPAGRGSVGTGPGDARLRPRGGVGARNRPFARGRPKRAHVLLAYAQRREVGPVARFPPGRKLWSGSMAQPAAPASLCRPDERRGAEKEGSRIATAPQTTEPRINDRIRAREVRLVDHEGRQLGIRPLPEALSLARELDLDLVEVAPQASPPVCRIMDYGKFKFDSAQRDKESRRKSSRNSVKEMKYRPKIGAGDFETKTRQVARFLEDGHKVKVTIMFRGREVFHPELGQKILERVAESVESAGKVETAARLDGRNMVMVLAPERRARPGNRPAVVAAAPAETPAQTTREAKETASAEDEE